MEARERTRAERGRKEAKEGRVVVPPSLEEAVDGRREKAWLEERRKDCTGGPAERGTEGGRRFLLRPASKMALAAAPLVIKINN